MNTKLQQSKAAGSAGDLAKYALALLLVVGGPVRLLLVRRPVADVAARARGRGRAGRRGAGVPDDGKGGHTREFLSEARFELRKVVWPTRQEAMRTTWVVIAVVIILSLMLAFFDVVVQAAVKWLLAR